jgi:hypothetical protein
MASNSPDDKTVEHSFKIVRENAWVVEYDTPWGRYVDSKYRTCDCTRSADEFVAAWMGGDEREQRDLEAAFVFFPPEPAAEAEKVLQAIRAFDAHRSERMRSSWSATLREYTAEQLAFVLGLARHAVAEGLCSRIVGECEWFRVSFNEAGFWIETKLTSIDQIPSRDILDQLFANTTDPLYRKAIDVIRNSPFLLAPGNWNEQR